MEHLGDGCTDPGGILPVADVVQQHCHTQECGQRVGDALPGDVRCGAVHGLEERRRQGGAEIRRGRQAQPADQPRGFIREDITKHVCRHDHVKAFRLCDQSHCHCVNQHLLHREIGVVCRHFESRLAEEPAGFG